MLKLKLLAEFPSVSLTVEEENGDGDEDGDCDCSDESVFPYEGERVDEDELEAVRKWKDEDQTHEDFDEESQNFRLDEEACSVIL